MATARAQRTLTSRCAPVCASSPRPRRKAAATRRECTSAPSDAAERLAALARKAGVALSGAVISAVLLTTSPQVRAARRAGAAIALRAPRSHPSQRSMWQVTWSRRLRRVLVQNLGLYVGVPILCDTVSPNANAVGGRIRP